MKKRLFLIICLVAAIALLGAASALFLMDREQQAAHKVIESEKPRVASPDAIDSEIKALVDGNRAFAFDLYQAIRETGGHEPYVDLCLVTRHPRMDFCSLVPDFYQISVLSPT